MSNLKERFDNYSKQPDERVWQSINGTLTRRTFRRRAITAASVSAAAAAIALALLVNHGNDNQKSDGRQIASIPVEQTVLPVANDDVQTTDAITAQPQSLPSSASDQTLLPILYPDDEVVIVPSAENPVSATPDMQSNPATQVAVRSVESSDPVISSVSNEPNTVFVAEEEAMPQAGEVSAPVVKPTLKNKAVNDSLVLMVPNAFSPNDYAADPEVRVFRVYPNTDATILSYKIYIYSRSGRLVYHSTDINAAWDGRSRGTDQPMGVYTYILEVTDAVKGIQHKKGTVTLLR